MSAASSLLHRATGRRRGNGDVERAEHERAATATPASPANPRFDELFSGDAPASLDYVFETARTAVDMQFRIAERLDTKARALAAAATAYFGAVQAIALRGDVLDRARDTSSLELLAYGAGVFLAVGLVATMIAVRLRREKDYPYDRLFESLTEVLRVNNRVAFDLAALHLTLAKERKEANRRRIMPMRGAQVLLLLSVLAASAQLAVAISIAT
jgi:hypothetical protein